SSLLLRIETLGDLDPSTQPTATVDGTDIRVDLNDECAEIFCDVVFEGLFRVELPPLAEGEYSVVVHFTPEQPVARDSFSLVVGPEVALPRATPSDGFWMPVDQPGTGLHLQ